MSEAAITLALDASTSVGSVAVLRGPTVLAEGEALMRGEREERLLPAVMATLAEAGTGIRELSRIVCGEGPGSFTSLRIAAAIAKGMALGNSAFERPTPLYAVSSLALIVAGHRPVPSAGRYIALIDALRGERYATLIEVDAGGVVDELELLGRLRADDVAATCSRLSARAIGPHEMIEAHPHARGAARLLPFILASGPVRLDTWEPEYGRLAEAQVKWETAQGRPLTAPRE